MRAGNGSVGNARYPGAGEQPNTFAGPECFVGAMPIGGVEQVLARDDTPLGPIDERESGRRLFLNDSANLRQSRKFTTENSWAFFPGQWRSGSASGSARILPAVLTELREG